MPGGLFIALKAVNLLLKKVWDADLFGLLGLGLAKDREPFDTLCRFYRLKYTRPGQYVLDDLRNSMLTQDSCKSYSLCACASYTVTADAELSHGMENPYLDPPPTLY